MGAEKEAKSTTTTKGGGAMKKRLIFTYGTLKTGFSNHRLMEDLIASGDASFVGSFKTLDRYPLVCGPYRVPFLLPFPGKGEQVIGEVYHVSDKGLARMDELEGTSRGHYQRLPIQITDLDVGVCCCCGGGGAVEAYFAHPSYAQRMWEASGEAGFECYTNKEAKGYVRRQDRPKDMTFLDHISVFLSSSKNYDHC